jgi:protein N-terminal methyltransferase
MSSNNNISSRFTTSCSITDNPKHSSSSSSSSIKCYPSKQQKIELLQRIQNYLTSKYAVSCGRDTNDEYYDTIIEFWNNRGLLQNDDDDDVVEYGDDNDNNEEVEDEEEESRNNIKKKKNNFQKCKWYKQSHEYWQNHNNAPTTIDGMLGGFSNLSDRDLIASKKFVNVLLKSSYCSNIIVSIQHEQKGKEQIDGRQDEEHDGCVHVVDKHDDLNNKDDGIIKNSTSCECGAGIGRITKGLLLPLGIKQCDLIETSPRLIQFAPTYIGQEHVSKCNFICQGLQTFQPIPSDDKYDIIWIQWVIGYLTDWDLVSFLSRMGKSLRRPDGIIVIKDNCCNEMAFLADCDDSDITRSFHYLMAIVKESGLKVVNDLKGDPMIWWQEDFPDDIWPVPMIALQVNNDVDDRPGARSSSK